MPVGKVVLRVFSQVIPAGAEMVIDHVEQHRQARRVRRVYQPFEAAPPTVGTGRGIQCDAIIAPVMVTGKIGHRHKFQRGDTQFAQTGQPLDQGLKGAGLGRRADMHFIDDQLVARNAAPGAVGPVERRIDHLRGAMHPGRLGARGRIGPIPAAVEPEHIVGTRPGPGNQPGPVTPRLTAERVDRGHRAILVEDHRDLVAVGCPDPEKHAAGAQQRPQRGGPGRSAAPCRGFRHRCVCLLAIRLAAGRSPATPAQHVPPPSPRASPRDRRAAECLTGSALRDAPAH